MPSFDIIVSSEVPESFRVNAIKEAFTLQINGRVEEHFRGEIPIENVNWNIGVIVGASGTGKSTIAKQVFGDNYIAEYEWDDRPIIDNLPEGKKIEEIGKVLNSVGFSTVWSWLKPYKVLSEGEKMRVNLARAILEERDLIVFDEFTSTINREVARVSSCAVAKAVRRLNKKFVAATCHYDILDWLEPDWVFDTNSMSFFLTKGNTKDLSLILKSVRFIESSGQYLGNITI